MSGEVAHLLLSAGARRLTYSYTAGGSFLVYDFQCSGSEESIAECNVAYFTKSNRCGDRSIAAVQCEGIAAHHNFLASYCQQ